MWINEHADSTDIKFTRYYLFESLWFCIFVQVLEQIMFFTILLFVNIRHNRGSQVTIRISLITF